MIQESVRLKCEPVQCDGEGDPVCQEPRPLPGITPPPCSCIPYDRFAFLSDFFEFLKFLSDFFRFLGRSLHISQQVSPQGRHERTVYLLLVGVMTPAFLHGAVFLKPLRRIPHHRSEFLSNFEPLFFFAILRLLIHLRICVPILPGLVAVVVQTRFRAKRERLERSNAF